MKIYIAADHAGFHLKKQLIQYLQVKDFEVEDCGAYELDEADDYPDFIIPCAQKVALRQAQGHDDLGIVIGGSGQAEAICANKVRGVRAVVFYGPILPHGAADVTGRISRDAYEMVKLTRMHNNANVLSLGARFLTGDEAKKAVSAFLENKFEGGRHERRIEKIEKVERG